MPLPAYIRYFAVTDGSPLGRTALEFCKSMLRIAPVRVVSVSGGMDGPWTPYVGLGLTAMNGASWVNAVCTHPSRWAQDLAVPMPDQDPGLAEVAGGEAAATEIARGRTELYTPKAARNVLFLASDDVPATLQDVAKRYEAIVVNTSVPLEWIGRKPKEGVFWCPVDALKPGGAAHAWVREAITGEAAS